MDDITKITLTIRVNHTAQNTEVRLTGDRTPLFMTGSVDRYGVGNAWRYLASYALERAWYTEHGQDLGARFTNAEFQKTALEVYEEYKNPFESLFERS